MIELVHAIIILGACAIVLTSWRYEKITGISPSPLLPWVRARLIKILRQEMDPDKTYQIVDLGAGWGGMTATLAWYFPNTKIQGYEISPWPWILSCFQALPYGRRVRIIRQDFFKADLNKYDVIICYLSPSHMQDLRKTFEKLRKGKVIISAAFPVPGWAPAKAEKVRGPVAINIYLYKT